MVRMVMLLADDSLLSGRQADVEGGAALGIAAVPQPALVQLDEGAADHHFTVARDPD